MKNFFFFLIVFLGFCSGYPSVFAVSAYAASHHLTAGEIQRVRAFKELLSEVDTKSLPQTITELEKARYPAINLEMREAIAKTYVDIVREQGVTGQKKKEWLYSMVCLNMAYLQFGGGESPASTSSLNKLILRKLKEYLPSDVLKQPGFSYSI
ncbi:MAG: hypothetical protein HQL14_04760 [Candidatus Omnitrophica bacterium]|nr:hypothetical protein [Candidatus Omnitrophota bacterium]